MDLVLLRTFLAVAETGSFSAAAAELNCVQSNVTARIRRLEQHLTQPVFERGRGGASLTELGERLRGHAEEIVARVEAAERDLLDAAGASAPLRLGSMETTAAVRLPDVLKRLRNDCPKAPVSLRTGTTGELLRLLWQRKIDAAFVAGPLDSRFRGVVAFRERLVAARARTAVVADTLFAFRTGCSYRTTAEAWLRGLGRGDADIVEMGTLEGILGCVEAGMGVAVLPASAVGARHGAEPLDITALPDPLQHVETLLAWRYDRAPTHAHRALIAQFRPPPARD